MLFNKTANICTFLEKKFNDPIVNLLFKELTKVFKLTKCPIPKVFKWNSSALNYLLINFKYLRGAVFMQIITQ